MIKIRHDPEQVSLTVEEYLTDVEIIYYQMSVIVKGKQLLAFGRAHRRTDIRDNKGKLGTLRFSTLSLPASIKVDRVGTSCAAIDFGGVRLVIWPMKEIANDVRRNSTDDPGP